MTKGPKLGDALRALMQQHPAQPTVLPSANAMSNQDRLVYVARQVLRSFGYEGFAGAAEYEIRFRTTEQTARSALQLIHEGTRPPYR